MVEFDVDELVVVVEEVEEYKKRSVASAALSVATRMTRKMACLARRKEAYLGVPRSRCCC